MVIYLSGGGVRGVWQRVNELLIRRNAARLLSFAYYRLLVEYCALVREMSVGYKVRLMVDSGAFTAWTRGEQVNRDSLEAFFKSLLDQYHDHIEFVLVNLDVIPGRRGVDPTPLELQEAQRRSEENFHYLSQQFPLMVMPVFHQGESTAYYDQLVRENEYVCLSPRNDLPERLRIDWAQRYSHRTTDRRYHGLAATGITMMETVNWYSVDSATWVMVAGYGGILWRNERKLSVLTVSAESNAKREFDNHIESMSDFHQKRIADKIAARGYSLDRLKTEHVERYCWNAEAWLDLDLNNRHMTTESLFDA